MNVARSPLSRQNKQEVLGRLRKEILLLQGFTPSSDAVIDVELGPIKNSFPNGVFPTGAIHELISAGPESAAASGAFVSGITAALMARGGACLWISAARRVFPPALKSFGIEPDRVVFIDLKKEREVLWAVEEALKCEGLAAVVGEIRDLDFTASRRLQLAVEQSRVTGFILRDNPRNRNTNAAVARWMIRPVASQTPVANMPGIGHPRWQVELLKIKNGKTGSWEMEWAAGRFQVLVPERIESHPGERRQTG